MRPLLALPICLLLMSCDSASSSPSANSQVMQGSSVNNAQQDNFQNKEFQNSNINNKAGEENSEEGQSLVAAANLNGNIRRSPMIASSPSESTLQATLMGDYGGIVPCASCDSIDVTLNLFADGSVLKTSVFNNAEPMLKPSLESGVYRQDDDRITIVYERKNIETYQIKDNHLIMLDVDKNPEDDYTLSRK